MSEIPADQMRGSDLHISSSVGLPLRRHINPLRMLRTLWVQRGLIWELARRDIHGRYRAAELGVFWALLTPLAMLTIYTFVFSIVLKARWGDDPNEGAGEFALYLFAGLLVFGFFSEVANRAPSLVVQHPNFVKKVMFPLETLAPASLAAAAFHLLLGVAMWLVFWFIVRGGAAPPLTGLLLPIVLIPLALLTLGIAWLVATLGVFLRDVQLAIGLLVQVLMFATPVFYRIDRVPAGFQAVMRLNPLSHALEDARRVLIEGRQPDWVWWGGSLAVSFICAVVGFGVFSKAKRAFADVM